MRRSEPDGPEPRLRRAGPNDAEKVRDLVSDAYSQYIPLIGRTPIPMLTDYADAIRSHEVWVLDADGTIVGVLELDPRPDHLWLENVAVLPDRQGRGLGRVLLEHAEGVARERELPEIRLLTNERYVANIATYERHGYVETHRQPHLGTDLVHFAKTIELDRPS
jgi:GNAT superfamily N-acetyltransferase